MLEEVNSSKYLGATLPKDGSSATDILIRITSATVVLARMDRVFHGHDICFTTKYYLYKFIVVPIPLYGCETLTLADWERRIQTFY